MKYILLTSFLILSLLLQAQHMHTDKPSIHGMVLFGKEKFYASHLPLFHSPHNYQIIIEIEIEDSTIYKIDLTRHAENATYTLEPEVFILPEQIKNLKPFKASIYRGHFERGGKRIASDVLIKINRIIVFEKFDSEKRRDEDAKYLIFGNRHEQFAVHQISQQPDFDQILQIALPLPQYDSTYIIKFNDSNYPVGVSGNNLKVTFNNKIVQVQLLRQLYLEFDDLK